MANHWKHWCPKGCGKKVIWQHNKNKDYKCLVCKRIFKKVNKDLVEEKHNE